MTYRSREEGSRPKDCYSPTVDHWVPILLLVFVLHAVATRNCGIRPKYGSWASEKSLTIFDILYSLVLRSLAMFRVDFS
jgi:hypothetical protein